ncbi:MAG: LysR family transcriptional regulator [Deltaproteobacteria bacterium]|nr:LysR family transcriptional regulator [Deltaproteobacteria bacterium]
MAIDFDLRQLEIFCRVVELKSFSKAADAVFLAQASVSERISNLEKAIGTKLLDRLGREVLPTKAGEILYKHGILLLDMKKTARLELADFLGIKQGEISIGGSTIPGEYILPAILNGFQKKYPSISVQLIVADTREIGDRVLKGSPELGVVGSKESDNNFIYHELWLDELVLAVPPQHRWAKIKSVSLKELSTEPFIAREMGSGTLRIIHEYLDKVQPPSKQSLNIVARLGTSTAVKEGIKAGLGVSILSSRALNTELKTGLLKTVKVKGLPIMSRRFYLIRDKRRIASPICQAMIDFLLASLK